MKYIVKGIPFSLRLTLFFLIEAGGIAVQLGISGGMIPGTILMAAGLLLVLARGYSNRPEDLGFEDWKPVATAEFQKIRTNLLRTRKIRLPLYYRGLGTVPFLLIGFGGIIAGFFLAPGTLLPVIAVGDTLIVGAPLFFSGLIRLWVPAELAMKAATFAGIADAKPGEGFVLTPYLRFDRDSDGRQIPEDVRFMLELRRNPEDFVGVQFQIAVNSGPNGKVPYMYAVFLCRGKGKSFRSISEMDFGSFIVEPGGDEEYGTVVVRQQTTGTGYHTDSSDCRRLYLLAAARLTALGG